MRTFESVADLAAAQGQAIGQSDWVTITQEDANGFTWIRNGRRKVRSARPSPMAS